jgi:hypothetical protein
MAHNKVKLTKFFLKNNTLPGNGYFVGIWPFLCYFANGGHNKKLVKGLSVRRQKMPFCIV